MMFDLESVLTVGHRLKERDVSPIHRHARVRVGRARVRPFESLLHDDDFAELRELMRKCMWLTQRTIGRRNAIVNTNDA